MATWEMYPGVNPFVLWYPHQDDTSTALPRDYINFENIVLINGLIMVGCMSLTSTPVCVVPLHRSKTFVNTRCNKHVIITSKRFGVRIMCLLRCVFAGARLHIHGIENVILKEFSSLAALEVVILTTSSAASDEKFIKMTTFSIQW